MTKRKQQVWYGALLLMFICANMGFAQSVAPDLQQEIEALKKGQQAIQKELQELKKLLQARRPTRPAGPDIRNTVFNLRDNPVKGEQTAKLTLVEFTDYQ